MSTPTVNRRAVPKAIWDLPIGKRIRWARTSAGFSHDTLVRELGRSNRGHLIKIEKGDHIPRSDLRNAIADATNVPRELFELEEDDEESDPVAALMSVIRRFVRDELRSERGTLLFPWWGGSRLHPAIWAWVA